MIPARVAKLADAKDLKSFSPQGECGFKSRPGHHQSSNFMPEAQNSSYDDIAGLYHALWADWYLPAAMPALEKLFFSQVPTGARVLDLCCGSGHVTKELVRRGYNVTGIDSSAVLIALARRDLPDVDLRIEDARSFELEGRYDAALSTFDSLNHILTIDELGDVFVQTHRALASCGLFVFDMNLEEAYLTDLEDWTVNVTGESIGLVRGSYNRLTQTARTEIIWFRATGNDNLWQKHRSVVEQRCYTQAEILLALQEAGFRNIEAIPARQAGVASDLGHGRIFLVAHA